MPRYKVCIDHIIDDKEVLQMLDVLTSIRDRALISFLWLTGARPSEVIEVKKEDIIVEPFKVQFKIPTKKLDKSKGFKIKHRILEYNRPRMPPNPFIEAIVIHHRTINDGAIVFNMTTRNIEYIVNKASTKALGYALAPYNFRHSRMTKLARLGYDAIDLKYFKGSKSIKSVEPYLHGKPFLVKNEGNIKK